jgi:N-acetyl sugar amidotransferase
MVVCKRCIMDNVNDPDLVIDSKGICNHCHNFDSAVAKLPPKDKAEESFKKLTLQMKQDGKSKKYDCMIGVSGGVDSTYLAHVAKEAGLRALLVHCDNGWNSELAVQNIQNICNYTGFDLYTLVLDWEEFKDIQLSFFKANVVDVELPYDYALTISIYKAALKFNVKYVLTGHNVATEGTYLPKSWRHDKMDILNIIDIHKIFGKVKMITFPYYNFFRQKFFLDKKLQYVNLLNFVGYNKDEVKKFIQEKMNWRDYGGKHYENVFTRFYQGYILNEKFKIDKRQFHLSVLVQSGQITREEALEEYKKPAYDKVQLASDLEFVIKKLNFTPESFNTYIKTPPRSHLEFNSIQKYWNFYFRLIKAVRFWK